MVLDSNIVIYSTEPGYEHREVAWYRERKAYNTKRSNA